jgi:hypothetical protein
MGTKRGTKFFTVRDGQIVHLRDYAHRSDALADAGLDYQWH